MISRPLQDVQRKRDLIDFGVWAVCTGRRWLVKAVERAIQQEGLAHD
jgi:hypothetical protein